MINRNEHHLKSIVISELESKESNPKNNYLLKEYSNQKYPIYYAPRLHNDNLLRLANYNMFKEKIRQNSLSKIPKEKKNKSFNSKNKTQYISGYSTYMSQSNDTKTEPNINYENNLMSKSLNKTIYTYHSKPTEIKKYPFIIDNHPILPKLYNGLPKIISNTNQQLYDSLKRDNVKIFEDAFCVISKNKFSSKFRNPFQERIIIKNPKDIISEKKKPKIKKRKKPNNEFKAFKALTIVKIARNTKTDQILKKRKHENLLLKFKKIIIKAATHFRRLTINLNEFFSKYPVSNMNKSKSYFDYLITAIKNKDLHNANLILDDCKYLVLESDYYKQTLLHWAAKRNFYQIIPKIVNYGADVDALDEIGFSPLHLGINNNNFDAVIFLFLYYASPFKRDKSGKKPIDYAKNYRMATLCKRATALHVVHLFGKNKDFYENVKRGFSYFVESEYKNEMEKEAYEIVSELAQDFRKKLYIKD